MNTDRDWETWFWTITSALAIAVLVALRASAVSDPNSNLIANPATAQSEPLPSRVPSDAPTPSRNTSRAAHDRIATVFECRTNGQLTYSDQRCGPSAGERPIEAPNRMDAQDTSILSSPDAVIARSRAERMYVEAPVADSARSECSDIEREKDQINARMREGYSSPEGERFRDELRLLGARYYELRCRHFH